MIGAGFPTDWLLTVDGATAFVIGVVAGVLWMVVRVMPSGRKRCDCERERSDDAA